MLWGDDQLMINIPDLVFFHSMAWLAPKMLYFLFSSHEKLDTIYIPFYTKKHFVHLFRAVLYKHYLQLSKMHCSIFQHCPYGLSIGA
jgi:hypothetical protein